jgi:hypothetical protein
VERLCYLEAQRLTPPQLPAFPVSYEVVSIRIQGAQFRQDNQQAAADDAVAAPVELRGHRNPMQCIRSFTPCSPSDTPRRIASRSLQQPSCRQDGSTS